MSHRAHLASALSFFHPQPKNTSRWVILLLFLLSAGACSSAGAPPPDTNQRVGAMEVQVASRVEDSVRPAAAIDTLPRRAQPKYDTTQWLELPSVDTTLVLDLRYATDSNFVGQSMYACGRAFLRPAAARALAAIQTEVAARGWRLKIWDAYRPLPVQWKLWKKVPDRRYVADPRRGSMHNRGVAVDLTLVDQQNRELTMGTPYDFFGREAWHSYTQLPDTVLANRRYLRRVMEQHGFRPTPTEWWHYSYTRKAYPLSDWEWDCP